MVGQCLVCIMCYAVLHYLCYVKWAPTPLGHMLSVALPSSNLSTKLRGGWGIGYGALPITCLYSWSISIESMHYFYIYFSGKQNCIAVIKCIYFMSWRVCRYCNGEHATGTVKIYNIFQSSDFPYSRGGHKHYITPGQLYSSETQKRMWSLLQNHC